MNLENKYTIIRTGSHPSYYHFSAIKAPVLSKEAPSLWSWKIERNFSVVGGCSCQRVKVGII